jgi:hypothetical protein
MVLLIIGILTIFVGPFAGVPGILLAKKFDLDRDEKGKVGYWLAIVFSVVHSVFLVAVYFAKSSSGN